MQGIRWFVALGAALALGAGAAAQSYKAGEYQTGGAAGPRWKVQANTGATHAGFAAAGEAAGYVDQHLGHALNCIEGQKGRNFDARWGNPCEGQGQGLLADLRQDPAGRAWLLVAEAADQLAVSGLRTRDLAQKKNAARGVSALLQLIAQSP